jgi:adenylyltransferase/sulfurtransferase
VEGQQRLLKGSVLVVGAGGLGCPVVQYLAAAGVGTLGVVDDDVVDSSNLQRQVLHTEAAQGTPKVDSAARAVGALNSGVTVRTHRVRLKAANALKVMAPYDVVVDACDNFPTRYLLNDAAVMLGKPLVHGSIWRFSGQVTVFKPGEGPCYRCLHPVPPPPGMVPSCQDAGVLGVLPGIIGTLQALEAMKLLAGFGRPLVGRLLQFEGLPAEAREIRIRREKQCPACGDAPTIRELVDGEAFCQQGSP